MRASAATPAKYEGTVVASVFVLRKSSFRTSICDWIWASLTFCAVVFQTT